MKTSAVTDNPAKLTETQHVQVRKTSQHAEHVVEIVNRSLIFPIYPSGPGYFPRTTKNKSDRTINSVAGVPSEFRMSLLSTEVHWVKPTLPTILAGIDHIPVPSTDLYFIGVSGSSALVDIAVDSPYKD